MEYAWNWAALQLSSGYEITAAVLQDPRDMHVMERRTLVVDTKGRRLQKDEDALFEPVEDEACRWRSVRTFVEYPVAWRLRIPSMEADLVITASFNDQEFTTFITPPAYWEGRVEVEGTMLGKEVTGRGFIERNGYDPLRTLPDFFRGVGAEVRRQVQAVYPDEPNEEDTSSLISSPETPQYLRGVPRDRLAATLLKPVRDIADRGGKSWRSYGALACCDVVGGDSRKYPLWLAMPEFMHVGSLIVDDIQDKSVTRRGGPCAHRTHGEPLCINSGTAAYFMCQKLIVNDDFTDAIKCRVYDLYFLALRAGHAGQALDIAGLDYLMDDVVRTGDVAVAEERVLAIHRLKTAAPAGSLARMGAVAGGGTEEQVEAVGNYYESVGVAFQIMDDVLNLRGLYTNKADLKSGQQLKVVGEDIMAGKVTIPIVKAMGVLDAEVRGRSLPRLPPPPFPHALPEPAGPPRAVGHGALQATGPGSGEAVHCQDRGGGRTRRLREAGHRPGGGRVAQAGRQDPRFVRQDHAAVIRLVRHREAPVTCHMPRRGAAPQLPNPNEQCSRRRSMPPQLRSVKSCSQ